MKSSLPTRLLAAVIFVLATASPAYYFLMVQAAHSKQYGNTLELAGKLTRDQSIYEQVTMLVEDEQKPVLALNGYGDVQSLKKSIYAEQDAYARDEQLTRSLERQLECACYLLVCVAVLAPVLLTGLLNCFSRTRPAESEQAGEGTLPAHAETA
jgi:hypothetical protein